MSDPTCPRGMVLINAGQGPHRDEPAFCIEATEVTQAADAAFWAARQSSGYELVVTKKDGTTETARNKAEAPLRAIAATQVQRGDVQSVTVHPVASENQRQPEGQFAGPKKPAIYRSWADAQTYCQGTYPGGDLPTERQWEQACGDQKYCTTSGTLNQREAIYKVNHPADVATTPANARGVYDLTGNVWEWMRNEYDANIPGFKVMRGGSWIGSSPALLRAAFRGGNRPGFRNSLVGFRCVARPQDSKK